MPTTSLISVPYRPSSPITGNESSSIFRGANLMLAGKLGENFYRAYAGSLNMGENYSGDALTGTISFSPASTTVTGVGTAFLTQLHKGQMIIAANSEPLVVARLVSPTSFIASRLPTTTGAGVAATIPPRLEAMDVYRIASQWGNAVLADKGNILGVGLGVLYKNGSVLPGSSMTLSRSVQLAIYASATANYSIEAMGFSVSPVTVNTDVTVVAAGGTKNMSLGYYSFKIGYYSTATNGYSDPGATLLSGGTAGYNVTVANSTINFDFTSDVANRPSNSDGYIVYASAFTNSSDQSAINAIQGPWYEVKRIPYTSLSGADAYAFDFTDADLGTLVSFNNTTPPNADWLALLTGYVVLISTNGQGVNVAGRITETSPGPFISPMKGDNIDAYPASYRVPTEKGEDIIGFVSTAGRLFCMTANSLQATTPTGLDIAPFTLRPFWKTGFANPNNLVAVNDYLYGFTSKGPYRSIATGDSAEATNDFASSVSQQMASWNAAHVYVAYDPKNRCVCYFHSGAYKNSSGRWVTEVYVYNLDIFDWTPPIVISSTTQDMIVTGVATIQDTLYFNAGGYDTFPIFQIATYAFDTPSDADVAWYAAWNYLDAGAEFISKRVSKIRAKGLFRNGATVKVYGVAPNSVVSIDDLEDGTNALYSYSVPVSTQVTQDSVEKLRVRNQLMVTCRINGTSNAATIDECDQLQELALDYSVYGQER